MAKITIAGNSFVVTSGVSMADWELIKKHRPQAMKIVDDESKEELFGVGLGSNNINDYGISFGGVSNGESKFATVTMPIPADVEDAKEYVTEKVGAAIISLNKIEGGIAKVLEEIKAEKKKVTESINVAT